MTSTRTLTGITPADVVTEIGDSPEVINAMVNAERYGHGRARGLGVTITHTGYQSGVTEFNASTALYAVRW